MSSIESNNRLFNLERGRVNEEEEEKEEEVEETGDVIFIVCCNGIELLSHKRRSSLRVGNNGIEVRFGHAKMLKEERRGKQSIINPSSIVDSSRSSSISSLLDLFHHPVSL
jgi:GTPase SAR1 family protein